MTDEQEAADTPLVPPAGKPTAPLSTRRKGGPLSGGLGVVVAVILFSIAGVLVWRTFYGMAPDAPRRAPRTFICTETRRTFQYAPAIDESIPVMSPHSGKRTGYPPETCYWTRDGGVKDTPTYVLLNSYLGIEGDTICPDCGRVVVPRNPRPDARGAPASGPAASPDDGS